MILACLGLTFAIATGTVLLFEAVDEYSNIAIMDEENNDAVSSIGYETGSEYTNKLYTGDISEETHITGAVWGEGHNKTLHDLYQLGFPGDLKDNLCSVNVLSYEIGLLDKPWRTYMNFNDKDELYRIDMTVSERVTGAAEERNQQVFIAELLDGLYGTYGISGGYLFPTESTADFTLAYKDLSTAENMDLFQANDFLSVTYKRNEMSVWVIIQREDYQEENLTERTSDILLNNELPYILGEKESPGNYITVPNLTDRYQRSAGSLLAQNRDSLFTAYIGYLNTRFEPPAVVDMEIVDESDKWPQPVLNGDVPADHLRIDNDRYILENYKK